MTDLTKAATSPELADLERLWRAFDTPEERIAAQLKQRALVNLGPPLPPIHQVLFC
jgi:hypothetical protein